MVEVYFLKTDQFKSVPDALEKAGLATTVLKNDYVAIKIHFGEKGNIGYIKPELIKPIIKKVKEIGAHPFVTDANTIYRGQRTDAVNHLMVASEHDFHPKFLGAPVIIADGLRGNSYKEVEVNLKYFKSVKVAEAIYHADSIISVAHFKGHDLCGMGGAIKNIGMGCASRGGKYEQHNSVVPKIEKSFCTACGACVKWCAGDALSLSSPQQRGTRGSDGTNEIPASASLAVGLARRAGMTIQLDVKKCIGCGQCILACNFKVFSLPWSDAAHVVQEKIAEYTAGILKGKRAIYVNFLTFITHQCDCFKTTTKPIMPDIGVLVSTDPVAIDQASMDLIKKHAGHDILKEKTGMDGNVQIEYAEKLGLGNRNYTLTAI